MDIGTVQRDSDEFRYRANHPQGISTGDDSAR